MKAVQKLIIISGIIVLTILISWIFLTIWAESMGARQHWALGNPTSPENVLIVYDPDPFYNLDEQVSRKFGTALAREGMHVDVETVAEASEHPGESYDLYVFCANTYNWMPDWAVANFIQDGAVLAGKPVVAITLGAGTTSSSQTALEKMILKKGGILLGSRSWWLMRPNDETRMDEPNVEVCLSMVDVWGVEMVQKFRGASPQDEQDATITKK